MPEGMLGPSQPLVPRHACLWGHDTPLEGHLLWNLALTTPGSARNSLLYFILFDNQKDESMLPGYAA